MANSNFLRLTEVFSNGSNTKILINKAQIVSVKKGRNGNDTHIGMMDGKYHFVGETVDEIEKML